jgi:hypothetical protein
VTEAAEPDLDVEVLPEESPPYEYPAIYYPWVADADEWRRTWIFEMLSDTELPAKDLINTCAAVEEYLKKGVQSAPVLKVVP